CLAKAPVGIYDIVDDEPLQRRELATVLAWAVHRTWLLRPPTFLFRLLAGKNAMFLTRSQRVTNRKFKEATGLVSHGSGCKSGIEPGDDRAVTQKGRTLLNSTVRAPLIFVSVPCVPLVVSS